MPSTLAPSIKTHSSIATDSAEELRSVIGDDATATFESDPKFIDSNPTANASTESVEVQRDTDDTADSEEEIEDADVEDDEDEEEDDEEEDDDEEDAEDVDDGEEDEEDEEDDEAETDAVVDKALRM